MLYIGTMRRSVDFWDTGEMQTVPWILGVAHPTGFPSFVLGGWLFSHLVPIGSVAFRMTLFSGCAMSAAAGLVFLAARQLRVAPPVACGGAWLFAATQLAWSRGTRTEVHALAICAGAALITLALRLLRTRESRGLPGLGLVAGLGLATHPVVLFALLSAGAVAATALRMRARARDLVATLGAFAAGMALYLYIPARGAWLYAHRVDPTLALGVPPGRPFWDYGHATSFADFLREVSGSDFAVNSSMAALLNPASYLRLPQGFYVPAVADFGLTATMLSLIGAVALRHRMPPLAAGGLLLGAATAIVFAVSYPAESDTARYFLLAFWMLALLATVGLQSVIDPCVRIAHGLFHKNDAPLHTLLRRRRIVEAVGACLLFFIVWERVRDHGAQFWNQPADPGAAPFIARVAALTPDDAVIVANWTYATPLAYAAYVEKSLGHRIVETAWPAEDAPYLPAWFARRPVIIVEPGPVLPATVAAARPLDESLPAMYRVDAVRTK